MQVFAFHKIIAICRILMSETWYTMDIFANRILCHCSGTIATKMFSFLFTDNLQRELSVYRKLSILFTMVTNCDLISYLRGYPSNTILLTLKSCTQFDFVIGKHLHFLKKKYFFSNHLIWCCMCQIGQNFKLRMILEHKEWSWNEKHFYANFMKFIRKL